MQVQLKHAEAQNLYEEPMRGPAVSSARGDRHLQG